MDTEQVLVIPRDCVQSFLPSKSLYFIDFERLVEIIRCHGFFIERARAENDSYLKQLIPYLTIMSSSKIFLLRRKSKQTEKRLHHMWSLGVGGHINLQDHVSSDLSETVNRAVTREFMEEIYFEGEIPKPMFIGLINDDSNDVGKVHLGLFYKIQIISECNIIVREQDKMIGQFVEIKDVLSYNPLEGWSEIVTKAFLLKQE